MTSRGRDHAPSARARRWLGFAVLLTGLSGAAAAEDGLSQGRARPATRSAIPPPRLVLRADAGDDQIGLVGRRITLNGGRSAPRGELSFRWILLSGPKPDQADQEGGYYSFVPPAAGVYRFGLVVAAVDAEGVRISEPDEVVVTVGELAAAAPAALAPAPPAAGPVGGDATAASAIDQMLRGPGAEAGRDTLARAAGVFDAIAARAGLYTSFAELGAEMSRRLDEIIPADPGWRQFWAQGIFAPLTQHLTSEMLASGLDLRNPQGQAQPLGPLQRERLEKVFAAYAQDFRTRSQAR